MRQFLIIISLILSIAAIAQTPSSEYAAFIKQADSLYRRNDYKNSGKAYTLAFKSFGWKGYSADRYNAACAWTLATIPDSAFSNLTRIAIRANFADYDRLISDPDLELLHRDARWSSLISKVKENKEKIEAKFDRKLIRFLDSLAAEDQRWRLYIVRFDNKQLMGDTISRKSILSHLLATDS